MKIHRQAISGIGDSSGILIFLLLSCCCLFCPCVASGSSTTNHSQCRDGMILPRWTPTTNLSKGDVVARGVVYFIALAYIFVGVSIIADRFMAAIEVITSKEKEVVIKKPNGETQTISVRIWNETVSNLTLMALGSSAPEILLSVIEVIGQDFEAGDLGPGTIVGSAAFNMFVIIAICVWAIPSDENRKIKHLRVFFVTMTWSVFAYIWLYLILTWSSHGVIEVWEGIVTFLFFPATVLTAYVADRRLLIYKCLAKKKYRMNKRGVIVGGEGGDQQQQQAVEMGGLPNSNSASKTADGGLKVFEQEEQDEEVREFEEHRREYIQLLRELRRKNPEKSMEELELMAREEILERGPKSRAFYRLQATKKLTGGGNLIRKRLDKADPLLQQADKEESKDVVQDDTCRVLFDPAHYTVMESVGQFAVTIVRQGGDPGLPVCVDFETEDGTAEAGSDYEPLAGTVVFRPGESRQQVFITVIDDDIFEEDEHFYVRLSNARYLNPIPDAVPANGALHAPQLPPLDLGTPAIATVMILDDDHSGVFGFAEAAQEVPESVGEYRLRVCRCSGARGRVIVPFRTLEGSAKPGRDYKHVEGVLVFENNENGKDIPIQVVDNESYERDSVFYVELGDPRTEEDYLKEHAGQPINEHRNSADLTEAEKIALLGKPRLGDHFKIQLRIKESKEFKNTVDKLFEKTNVSLTIGTSSWKEQFLDVITVSAGDDDDDEGGGDEERMPSCSDYVMHFFTIFWKVLFAFVPPTDCLGGWACFVCSIAVIGLLTALVGDLASHFGCTVGLRDSVTAISLVALGTSVPDTFASKVAAQNDKYADSSIGNVTGSNAVNVFLGIGLSWSIAALYHAYWDRPFKVQPGNLAFSVTLFCGCAFICCTVLMLRRSPLVGGELGGPMKYKAPTVILFVGLWLFYVLMSSLEAYEVIKGF